MSEKVPADRSPVTPKIGLWTLPLRAPYYLTSGTCAFQLSVGASIHGTGSGGTMQPSTTWA